MTIEIDLTQRSLIDGEYLIVSEYETVHRVSAPD